MALEAFWLPLLPAYLIGLLASWALEALLLPRPQAPWRRGAAANLTHVGVWTLAFALEMALFQRPYFAIANVLAIELLLVLVSRAKYEALQEPFVYPDFEYFTDAIKHPRLYLPFFGWGKALAAASAYGIALWMGLVFEQPITAGADIWWPTSTDIPEGEIITSGISLGPYYLTIWAICALGLMLARCAGRKLVVTFDADGDLQHQGLIGALWAYARAERMPAAPLLDVSPFLAKAVEPTPGELPHLVCIQSESFFDVRRHFPIVKRDVLANFDEICAEALAHGELEVAARGANTVRTEFAFLSGLEPEALGVHRYNPYRKLAAEGVPSLASYLKGLGYRTICVHPYYGDFYRRDKVLPKLGFDDFIDLSAFSHDPRDGPYVTDKVLAEYVVGMLSGDSSQPLYIHVITMENHGPLHCEVVEAKDISSFLNAPMPQGCADLVAYSRHIKNADEMFFIIKSALNKLSCPAGMCVFGDHIPIMPKVYQELGEPGSMSDYFIWHNRGGFERRLEKKNIAELGGYFLSLVGLGFKENDKR